MGKLTRIQKIIAMKPRQKKEFIKSYLESMGYLKEEEKYEYINNPKINAVIYLVKYPQIDMQFGGF